MAERIPALISGIGSAVTTLALQGQSRGHMKQNALQALPARGRDNLVANTRRLVVGADFYLEAEAMIP
jgi:hypothetical protein